VSKSNSANLQMLPAFSRLTAIVNQYFPDMGQTMCQLLHKEFSEL